MNNKNKIVQKLAMPSAAKLIEEKNLDIDAVIGTGVDGRVTKGDVLLYLNLNHLQFDMVFVKVKLLNQQLQTRILDCICKHIHI